MQYQYNRFKLLLTFEIQNIITVFACYQSRKSLRTIMENDIEQISIKWITTLRATDILKQYSGLPIQAIEKYKKDQLMLEQFQIFYKQSYWNVLKTNKEIKQFLQYLQKNFPLPKSEILIPNAPIPRILNILKKYKVKQNDKNFINFFEIEDLDYDKIKSIKLQKKCGGRYVDKLCCNLHWLQWKQRNFIITKEGILYYKQKNGQKKIGQYIYFNKDFNFSCGIQTGYQFGVKIKSYHRNLQICTINYRQFVQFIYYLGKAYQLHNIMRKKNMYGAFSSPKQHNNVQFYVDGQDYFKAVALQLQNAKEEVMIAGWWISPQFHLIRPIDTNNPQKYRLNTILKQLAQIKNVKIYILAYRQSPSFLPNDSKYTKQSLQNIHPNIKVITHPLNMIPSLWSHHQKIVLIDQKTAFVGGLDICYGRYDTNKHSIIQDKDQQMYPGIQYNNCRIKDFQKVRQFQTTNLIKSKHPRLPWHDVSMKIVGESVSDVSRHFIEYWNFASFENLYQNRIVLVPNQGVSVKLKDFFGEIKNKILNRPSNSLKHSQVPQRLTGSYPNPKMTYQNQQTAKPISTQSAINEQRSNKELQKGLKQQDVDIEIQIDQGQVYRYDQNNQKTISKASNISTNDKQFQIVKKNKSNRKSSLQIDFPRRFKKYKKNKAQKQNSDEQYDSDNGQYIKEKPYFQMDALKQMHYPNKNVFKSVQQLRSMKNLQKNNLEENDIRISNFIKIDKCQVLRSVSKWSIGCKQDQKEASIHAAYIQLIRKAQNFIYIENQFFMSAIEGEQTLKNQIAKAIIQRISRAITQKKKFKVLVILPLIPGFAGQLDDPDAVLPRVIMNWQLQTIYNHKNSIIKSIQRLTKDPKQYIQFFGLRTHNVVNQEPVTQIVYLHSKLMIVDDRKAIIGSANINDRSMRGSRDSQIAVVISDGKTINSCLNGEVYKVHQKIHNLRVKLMNEHFGGNDERFEKLNLIDLFCQKTFQKLRKISEENTSFYRRIFGCYPDDLIKRIKDIREFRKTPSLSDYALGAKNVRGHIVEYPCQFLQNQNLLQGFGLYPNVLTT